jgi:hypothetical protein
VTAVLDGPFIWELAQAGLKGDLQAGYRHMSMQTLSARAVCKQPAANPQLLKTRSNHCCSQLIEVETDLEA